MAVEHGQEHGQAVLLQPHREPLGREAVRIVHQCLNFHQQRPRAFLRDQHARAGHIIAIARQKNRRWVGHTFQSLLGHRKHTQLIGRAEAVFHRPYHAVIGMLVALEIKHRVHHMLEHARAGNRTIFGNMPHQNHRNAHLLGHARELRRTFAHLRHRARRGRDLVGIHGLNRIDHHHRRLVLL